MVAVCWNPSASGSISEGRRSLAALKPTPSREAGIAGQSRSKYPRSVAAELRCSRRRIVSASTPYRMADIPRTARAHARAAARRPSCDITWRYAHRRGSAAVPPSPPLFASPHNTRYVFGRRAAHRARAHALRGCVHVLTHAHTHKRVHVLHTPTFACVCMLALRVEILRVFVTAAVTRSAS